VEYGGVIDPADIFFHGDRSPVRVIVVSHRGDEIGFSAVDQLSNISFRRTAVPVVIDYGKADSTSGRWPHHWKGEGVDHTHDRVSKMPACRSENQHKKDKTAPTFPVVYFLHVPPRPGETDFW